MPEPSILDARLAEIDRRLESIQLGLEPTPEGHERPEPAVRLLPDPDLEPVAAPAPGRDAGELAARLQELADAHRKLSELTARLLATGPRPAPVSLSAGPFASLEALRRFERTLASLPEVGAVTLREYAGDDRAVLDVQLREPTA
jgi:hypothetical protein